ncbi:unnamed protein product [Phytomonas sp. Hart1]|nr:unnamed protein product [Phytomonas sp. Hart1]|eukprot:CCW67743.1 unnamed protein product [Phytomonas sp. isolate Hart1]
MDEFVRLRAKEDRPKRKRADHAVVRSFSANTLATSLPVKCPSEVEAKEGGNPRCLPKVLKSDRDRDSNYPEVSPTDSELSKPLHKMPIFCQASSNPLENSLHGRRNHPTHHLPALLRDTVLCSHDGSGLSEPFSALAVDIETTGLSPNVDQIIELGCVELRWNGCGVCGKDISENSLMDQWVRGSRTFHRLVRLTVRMTRGAAGIHHLSDQELRAASDWKEVSKEFKVFCDALSGCGGGASNASTVVGKGDPNAAHESFILPPLIAHNAQFDGAFIENCLMQAGYRVLWHPLYAITCTKQLARQLYPQYAANLDRVSAYLGVPGAAQRMQTSHSAFRDAIQCAKVFLRLAHNVSVDRSEKRITMDWQWER